MHVKKGGELFFLSIHSRGNDEYEEIYLKEYSTVKELSAALKKYFEFYNYERPHQSLETNTPAEVYWGKDCP